MKFQSKEKEPDTISLSRFEDYRQTKAKFDELAARHAEVQGRLVAIQRQRIDAEARRNETTARAEILISGKADKGGQDALDIEEKRLWDQDTVLREALRIQGEKLDAIRNERSRQIVKGIFPAFEREVRAYYEHVQAAQAAQDSIMQLRQKMAAEGVVDSLPACFVPGINFQNWAARLTMFKDRAKGAGIKI